MWKKRNIGKSQEPQTKPSTDPDMDAADKLARSYKMDKATPEALAEIYQILNARRLQWDNLLWQVPLISITGESFLFTIILSSTTSHGSREIACALAVVIAGASLATLARHRLSEVHDANLLAGIERMRFKVSIHGPGFSTIRSEFNKSNVIPGDIWDFIIRTSTRTRAYPIWIAVFMTFIVGAIGCGVLDFLYPTFFAVN